jgi:hypothetical protein
VRTAMLTLATCGLIGLVGAADGLGDQQGEAVAREIVGQGTSPSRERIAKQVDFSKEYLLYFRWDGVANDKLSFALEKGPLVVISFTPGNAKNKENHERVYALPKNTKWRLVETKESSRTPGVTKISNAEELATTFPDSR